MKSDYQTPVCYLLLVRQEATFMYSGLKDMPDNPVYPIEDLDDDN